MRIFDNDPRDYVRPVAITFLPSINSSKMHVYRNSMCLPKNKCQVCNLQHVQDLIGLDEEMCLNWSS